MDITPYRIGHKQKIEEEGQERQRFYEQAIKKAKEIAIALSDEFPGIEAWLFGSLATGLYHLESDIDMALKGLEEEKFFKAWGIAESIGQNIAIDLVQFEYAPVLLQERIKREGVRL